MSETLEEIKKTIATAHELGIYNWNTSTISSLITTIESQKEEIERLQKQALYTAYRVLKQKHEQDAELYIEHIFKVEAEVESLKAITELAVNELKRARERFDDFDRNWDCSEDAHKYNTPCRVCESVKSRDLIDTTILQIERLKNE